MSKTDKDKEVGVTPSEKKSFGSRMGALTENLIDVLGRTITYTERAAEALSGDTKVKHPLSPEMMIQAGKTLKDMRKTAGLSLEDLSSVVKAGNPNILKRIEEGQAALSVELMLRLASLYSRNDPLPFILRFSHTYHPGFSEVLKKIGLDRLLIQAERELEFINIYRSADGARELSDEAFDRVLEFTQKAFETALYFASTPSEKPDK